MKKKRMWILCIALLAILLLAGAMYAGRQEEPIENAGVAVNAEAEITALTYQGVEYPLKEHIQTVLLIGTDSMEAYEEKDTLLNYYNFNQADALLLLVLDQDTNTAQILQLNRDTMADVPWLDVLGTYGGTEYKQICLAYNYGDGGAVSCKNTVNAVSGLLFGAPIRNYIQLPMTAMGLLNDLVGGVPVTLEEDLTVVDPAFVQGATIRLNGDQAEKFIRARMELPDDTNVSRMRRQRVYMDSFQTCAKAALDSDSQFAMKLVETLAEYLQSNMTAQQLSQLVEKLDQAEISPIGTPEGKLRRGEYYEFIVDEGSLWELVKNAYCA